MSSPSSLASANARRRPPKMKPKTATLVLVCLCSLALNAFQRHLATKRVGGSGHKEPDQTYQDDLARWRDYAASMNASMYEADYRQIFDDLQVGCCPSALLCPALCWLCGVYMQCQCR